MITAAKEAELIEYINEDQLKPKQDLSRAEAVEILSKTSLAKYSIADLYNFDIGYGGIRYGQKID